MSDPTGVDILNTVMSPNDADAGTIREYLIKLLTELWKEQECFNSKRPFGNSDWEYELHGALLDAGFVDGSRDEDGYIDSCDDAKCHGLIHKAIRTLGSGT
jgi:hypothetical protein